MSTTTQCLRQNREPLAFLFVVGAVPMLIAVPGMLSSYAVVFLLIGSFLFLMTGMVALPIFLLMRFKGWLRWNHVLVAGLLCGEVIGLMMTVGSSSNPRLGPFTAFAAFGGAMGLLFWWLAYYRNPRHANVTVRLPWWAWAPVLLLPLLRL